MKYKAKILSVLVLRLLRIRKTNGGKEKKRTHGGKHDIYALSSPLDFPKQWKRCTINREYLSSYLCSVHHLLQWVQTNLAIWLSFPFQTSSLILDHSLSSPPTDIRQSYSDGPLALHTPPAPSTPIYIFPFHFFFGVHCWLFHVLGPDECTPQPQWD